MSNNPRHLAPQSRRTYWHENLAERIGTVGHGRHRDLDRLPITPTLGEDPSLDEVRAELDTPVDVSGVTA